MRIGIVSEWFDRGASYVSWLYRETLVMQGHEVFIYARGDSDPLSSDRWVDPSVTVGVPCRVRYAKGIDKRDFLSWLRQRELDWVLFNEQHWIPPVLWAREAGVRTAAYVDYYRLDTVADFQLYDLLICNTRRHLSAFPWHPNAVYVPWGTDTNQYRPSDGDINELTFFHSCGWSPERKGTVQAIRVWSEMASESSRLVVHSQIDISDDLGRIGPQVQRLQRDGALQIITETVPPPGLYRLGHVYLYPTRLEGLGLSQYEALSCGLPLIVPDDAPMNEVATPQSCRLVPLSGRTRRKDGYYWQMNSIADVDLAEAISYYVDQVENRHQWRLESRAHAQSHLDWYRNSSGLGELLLNTDPIEVDMKYARRCMRHSSGRFSSARSRAGTAVAKALGSR